MGLEVKWDPLVDSSGSTKNCIVKGTFPAKFLTQILHNRNSVYGTEKSREPERDKKREGYKKKIKSVT